MVISNELRKLVDPNNECCCDHCFSNKCKEWLKGKVSNCNSGFDNGNRAFCSIEDCSVVDRFYEETEPEAIFKATQYIYDNLSNS